VEISEIIILYLVSYSEAKVTKVMLTRYTNSFAFRSGKFYHWILNRLPNPVFIPAPLSSFTLISITGKKYLSMLRENLNSINSHWSHKPSVVLCSDGSMSPEEIKNSFNWWKAPLEVIHWEDSRNWALANGHDALASYCDKKPMGKKFCFVLHQASRFQRTLWCDADYLWFKDYTPPPDQPNFYMMATVDFQPAYDPAISAFRPQMETTQPFVNAGILWFCGNYASHPQTQERMKIIPPDGNHFTEQTWMALNILENNFPLFPKEEIICAVDDQMSLRLSYPGKPWVARHYVGNIRHIFWRDALGLRLNIK